MQSSKLLRIKDVSSKTTLAKSTIWRRLALNKFPKPIKITSAINVWRESDIDDWIEEQFNSNGESND
jgi:prophage regulatory protein